MSAFTHGGQLASRQGPGSHEEDPDLLELIEDAFVEVDIDPRGTLVFRSTEEFELASSEAELLRLKLQELHVRTGLRWWLSVEPDGKSATAGCCRVLVQAPFQEQQKTFARLARAGFDQLQARAGLCC